MTVIDIGQGLDELRRCPFVRALDDDDEHRARQIAAAGDDGVTGPAADWLVTAGRALLGLICRTCRGEGWVEDSPGAPGGSRSGCPDCTPPGGCGGTGRRP